MSLNVDGTAADSTTVTGTTAWMAADEDPIRISKPPASVSHPCRRSIPERERPRIEADFHGLRLTRLQADLGESAELLPGTPHRCLDIPNVHLDDLASRRDRPCW